MSSRKALGRGLNALLPPDEDAASPYVGRESERAESAQDRPELGRAVGRVHEVPIAHVVPNPLQPRIDFDQGALDELAASIRQLGIIQPITVRVREGGGYELISGERRLRAAKRAGLDRIPAYVRSADAEEMLEMALVENVQRESLNPIEVALGYQRLMDECSLTQEEVADKVGKNRSTVANFVRLLKLPPRIQAAIRDGRLSAGHARALVTLTDESVRDRLLDEIVGKELSVRQVEHRVRALQREARRAAGEAPRPDPRPSGISQRDQLLLQQYTNRLRSRFGTQVQIRHKSNSEGGKIEISYYSADDLERVLELLAR
ncbi:MAG TPA: ParB/RepB/Spo0J family partition protein [Rhodothermales bacterium]